VQQKTTFGRKVVVRNAVLPSPALSGTGSAGRGLHARLSAWITKLPVNIDKSVAPAQGRVNLGG